MDLLFILDTQDVGSSDFIEIRVSGTPKALDKQIEEVRKLLRDMEDARDNLWPSLTTP
jgi:hypothetical protein